MKKVYRLVLASLLATALLSAPTADDLNEGLQVQENSSGVFTLSWWGKAGFTYFIQQSEDLINWHYVPVIESGDDDVISWGFSSNAPRLFFKLRGTNALTNGDPNTADFDGDGLSNLDELENGLDPFSQTEGPPVAAPLSVETLEDTAVELHFDTVSRPSTGSITYEIVDAPQIGRIEIDGTNFQYIPHAHVHGIETFTFRAVYNGTIAGPLATAIVTITPVNDPPLVYAGANTNATVGVPLQLEGQITDVDTDEEDIMVEWRIEQSPQGGSVQFSDPSSLETTATFSLVGEYLLRLTAIDGVARADLVLINVVDVEAPLVAVLWNLPEFESTSVPAQSGINFEATINAGSETVQSVELLRGSEVMGDMEPVAEQPGRYRYIVDPIYYGVRDYTVRLRTVSGQTFLADPRRVTATLTAWINDPTPGNGTGNPSGGLGGVALGQPAPQPSNGNGNNGEPLGPSNPPVPNNTPNLDTDGDGIPDALDAAPNDPLIRWARAPEAQYVVVPLSGDWSPIALNDHGEVLGHRPNPNDPTQTEYGHWDGESWNTLPAEMDLIELGWNNAPTKGAVWPVGMDNNSTIYGTVMNTEYPLANGTARLSSANGEWDLVREEKLLEEIDEPDAEPPLYEIIVRSTILNNVTLNGKTSEWRQTIRDIYLGNDYEQIITNNDEVNGHQFEDKYVTGYVTRSGYALMKSGTSDYLLMPDGSTQSYSSVSGRISIVEGPPQSGSTDPGTVGFLRREAANSAEAHLYVKHSSGFVPSSQPPILVDPMGVGEGLMNAQGIAMMVGGNSIWRNGSVTTMDNLATGDWGRFRLADINDKGTILASAQPITARDQNGHPTSFGDEQSVLLVPIELKWEAIAGWNNVEDNKSHVNFTWQVSQSAPLVEAEDGLWLPGRGKRIFPDKDTPSGTARNRVMLKIKGASIREDNKVFVRVYDVDDPTPDQFAESIIDTNGDAGADNYGSDSDHDSIFEFISSASVTNPTTGSTNGGRQQWAQCEVSLDNNGEAVVELKITMQPGDNYRAAAVSQLEDFELLQIETPNAPGYIKPNSDAVPRLSGAVSEMLTVWRKLRIELDSMEAIPDPKPYPEQASPKALSWSSDGKTLRLAPDSLSTPVDFYKNGYAIVGETRFKIVANPYDVELAPGGGGQILRHHFLTFEDTAAQSAITLNAPVTIVDDDLQGLPSDFDPILPRRNLINNKVVAKFVPAYIQLVVADDGLNPNNEIDFDANADVGLFTPLDDAKDLVDTDGFWSHLVVAAYQSETPFDRDPDEEEPDLGLTWSIEPQRTAIYLEAIRDIFHMSLVSSSETVRNLAKEEFVNYVYGVTAHEIGHGPSSLIPIIDDDHSENGLMMAGAASIDKETFRAKTINRFRKAIRWGRIP